MKKLIYSIIEDNFDNEINNLQEILRLNSVLNKLDVTEKFPLGENLANTLDKFLDIAASFGFSVKNIDNVVGYAEMGDGGELIGILAHLDTVPLGDVDKWIAAPLDAKIIDDKIYARGAMDDKGPAMAILYAMKALSQSGAKLNKRFRLIVGLDEETGFSCVQRYLKTEEVPTFSFSPDASFPAVYAEKGIISFALKRNFTPIGKEPVRLLGLTAGERTNVVPDEARAYFGGNIAKVELAIEKLNNKNLKVSYIDDLLEVKAIGKSTHAMHAGKGINAIQILLGALAELDYAPNELMRFIKDIHSLLKYETNGKSLNIAMSDEISGELTFNTAVVRYDGKELVMKFDIRYPVTKEPNDIEEKIHSIAKRASSLVQIIMHKHPLYISPDNKNLQTLVKAYQEITNDNNSSPIAIGGGTYARAFPNSFSFGAKMPNDEEVAHEINEYITIENLKLITKIFALGLFELNGDKC